MYLRRIEADPENPQGYAYIAQFYNDQINTAENPETEFDKAVRYYKLRLELEPDSATTWYAIGVNRFWKAFRLQKVLPLEARKALAEEARKSILKAVELDPNDPYPYVYMSMLYINVYTKIYPERKGRYDEESKVWRARYDEALKKQLERKKARGRIEKNREVE